MSSSYICKSNWACASSASNHASRMEALCVQWWYLAKPSLTEDSVIFSAIFWWCRHLSQFMSRVKVLENVIRCICNTSIQFSHCDCIKLTKVPFLLFFYSFKFKLELEIVLSNKANAAASSRIPICLGTETRVCLLHRNSAIFARTKQK